MLSPGAAEFMGSRPTTTMLHAALPLESVKGAMCRARVSLSRVAPRVSATIASHWRGPLVKSSVGIEGDCRDGISVARPDSNCGAVSVPLGDLGRFPLGSHPRRVALGPAWSQARGSGSADSALRRIETPRPRGASRRLCGVRRDCMGPYDRMQAPSKPRSQGNGF